MYVRPISTRLLSGMLIPAMRAMTALPLTLLVPGVLADHEHPTVAADDLALFTHRLDRRSYLHDPFRLMIQTGWLWRPGRPPLPCPGAVTRRSLPAPSATAQDSKARRGAGPPATWLRAAGRLGPLLEQTRRVGAHRPADPAEPGYSARDARRRRARGLPRRVRAGRRPRRGRALPAGVGDR